MENTKSNIILSISLALVFLITIGVSYAYFSARIIGVEEESTIAVKGGIMEIEYNEGANIEMIGIYPKEDAWCVKTFTVKGTNTTDLIMNYKIGIEIEENTFSEEALTYTIENTLNEGGNPLEDIESAIIKTSGTQYIGYGSFNKGNEKYHNYTIKIYFKNNGEEQNENQKAVFKGKIVVEECLDNELITVTFNPDGGNLSETSKTVLANGVYGTLPKPTKEGYEFLGWNGKNMFDIDDFMKTYTPYQTIPPQKVMFDGKKTVKIYGGVNSTGRSLKYMQGKFDNNTIYTISMDSFDIKVNGNHGILMYLHYFDILTESTNIFGRRPNKDLHWWYNTITSTADNTINYITTTYSGSAAYSYIRNWQIEEGEEATPYEPYYITENLNIVQNYDHTLKAIYKEI